MPDIHSYYHSELLLCCLWWFKGHVILYTNSTADYLVGPVWYYLLVIDLYKELYVDIVYAYYQLRNVYDVRLIM